jgi:hypothetical protein
VGGFSTNEVSVVMKVASASPPGPGVRSRNGEFCSCADAEVESLWRVKD